MHSRGFTLVELLVIMTISAILVAMAVPMFTTMIHSNRISSATNTFLASLEMARSEAIRRARPVTLCRSLAPTVATPACSSSSGGGFAADDWAAGWIVFVKAPGNLLNGTVQAGDDVFIAQNTFQAGESQRVLLESTLPTQSLTYTPRGLIVGGGFLGMTLFADHRDVAEVTMTNMAKCVAVNMTGRPRAARVVSPGVCEAD